MKSLKAHWLLSDEALTTVIHLEATPSTSDVRWMTAIVGCRFKAKTPLPNIWGQLCGINVEALD